MLKKREEGYGSGESLLNSLFKGVGSYMVNQLPTEGFFNIINNKAKGNTFSFIMTSIATQGMEEGLEEGVEYVADDLIDAATLGTDSRLMTDTQNFLLEGLSNVIVGAMAGGFMGGAGAINVEVKTKRQYNAVTRDIKLVSDYMNNTDLDAETRTTPRKCFKKCRSSC